MNTITFGGVLSSTYDIYISGEGVWSAPERDAEVITIPGRNGAFVQDNGRFQNITVTYPAFIVKNNNTNFKTKIDGFRNAMASKIGYQRLVDTFHTDEYRMAAFIGGLEVEPILYNDHAATFDLVFECKPQRYLTSGEIKTVVSDGDTITNPTLFASSPMIEAKGYGDIQFNNKKITLQSGVIGDVVLWQATKTSIPSLPWREYTITKNYSPAMFNPTDTISFIVSAYLYALANSAPTYTSTSSQVTASAVYLASKSCYALGVQWYITLTAGQAVVHRQDTTFSWSASNYVNIRTQIDTTASGEVVLSAFFSQAGGVADKGADVTMGEGTGNSTLSLLGDPTYIDCDLGEAYKINDGKPVSLNSFVDLGSKLPELAPGINEFTVSNTFTEVAVVPRWWKI